MKTFNKINLAIPHLLIFTPSSRRWCVACILGKYNEHAVGYAYTVYM